MTNADLREASQGEKDPDAPLLDNHPGTDRILAALRSAIHNKGRTQRQVQNALGWGRTYISQLFGKQKALRLDQVLMILEVIEIEPSIFFQQVFAPQALTPEARFQHLVAELIHDRELRGLLEDLVQNHVAEALHELLANQREVAKMTLQALDALQGLPALFQELEGR